MSGERGIALIAVLGTLAVLSVVAAAVVASSQTGRMLTSGAVRRMDAVYVEESAAAIIIWRIADDRAKNAARTAGTVITGIERFQADGRPHTVGDCTVRIYDANSGLSVSGSDPAGVFSYLKIRHVSDPAMLTALDDFTNRISDYVDSDDFLRPNSYERADYELSQKPRLPRNGVLQYREELLWIPGGEAFFEADESGVLTAFNQVGITGGRPHFLSAPLRLIQDKCGFDANEMATVKNGIEQMTDQGIAFDEAFKPYPGIREKLRQEFSMSESGTYLLKITKEGSGRTLQVTLLINSALPPERLIITQWMWL
ncbi:MAG: hypothetical protein AB7F40_09585 [Victivallaceae bacterium]